LKGFFVWMTWLRFLMQAASPFRPLKGKLKPNANTEFVLNAVLGCFALVSPLGDGRG